MLILEVLVSPVEWQAKEQQMNTNKQTNKQITKELTPLFCKPSNQIQKKIQIRNEFTTHKEVNFNF